MRILLLRAALFSFLALTFNGVSAQTGNNPPVPRPEDVSTLDGIMKAYYEVVSRPAGQAADRARDRSLHYPGARIAITGQDAKGKPFIESMTLEEYHNRYGGAMKTGFYEWEIHREVQQFGNVTHVWSTYVTSQSPSGPATARGINSIQLYFDGQRWWVMSWLFDSERSGFPIPAAYLPEKEDWVQLFNGRDLGGWTPKINGFVLGNNYGNTFRVEDGVMKVAYDQYPAFGEKFGHIFYEKPFSYYKLKVEYRFTGPQAPGGPDWAFKNSGVMIHCQSPESMTKNQNFPISIEVQFLGGRGDGQPRPTCNLCTPGTHVVMDGSLFTPHCVNSKSKTFHDEQWVTAELLVLGDSLIQHFVNGDKVLEYSKPQIGGGVVDNFDPAVKKDGTILTGGYISLQSESHPIEFRKVELLNLEGCMDPKAKNFKPYYVKADNSKCLY